MGRHSNGKNNYSLSAGAITALVAAALLISGAVWFVASRSTDAGESEAAECVAGNVEVPVSSSDERVARDIIDAYASSHPVVRDLCVSPIYTTDLAASAVHIAPNNPVSHQQLAKAGRTAASSEPQPVAQTEVGLAGTTTPPGDVDLGSVSFPVQEQPAASAVAAARLAAEEAGAITALTDQRIGAARDVEGQPGRFAATAEDAVPEGLHFTPLDVAVTYTAIPLNQAGSVTEEQARAGQDLARFAAERFDGDASRQPQLSETMWAAATPTGGENESADPTTHAAPSAEVLNTLFVLDTSDAMAPFLSASAEAIGAAAQDVTSAGKSVALWNYSSPLNPGVTRGYRQNIDMTTHPSAVATSAARLASGGQPQTREALTAAVQYASQLGAPTRIVLLTTGTSDGGDDTAFTAGMEAANDGVELSVVHVGPGMEDPSVKQLAQGHTLAADAGAIRPAVVSATGARP